MTAVMSGEVQLSLAPVSVAVAQANVGKVTVGKVKALAITSRGLFIDMELPPHCQRRDARQDWRRVPQRGL